MNDEAYNDFEDARVLETLAGAERRSNDPDIQLARLLPQLIDSNTIGSITYEEVLEELIRGAHPH